MSDSELRKSPAQPDATPKKRRRYSWTFKTAIPTILGLALWMEVVLLLANEARFRQGSDKWLFAVGFFFSVLPLLAIVVYRWSVVFDFFRSVKVGVTNLVLIGLASIFGVLFHQEDPNRPIPAEGMDELANWEKNDAPWSPEARRAYQNYRDFRQAHAYFYYNLLEGRGLGLLGFDSTVDLERVQNQMEEIRPQIPPIRDRYGEEFAVAIETSSERGLINRQRSADIQRLGQEWDNELWSLFVWAHRLDFIRVYKSDWFAVFWAILFGGVLSNTFRGGWRRLLRPNKWGFVVTHLGVMLIILGGFWGKVSERRGILNIYVGETRGAYQMYSGVIDNFQGRSLFSDGLPFLVRLDGFRADYHDVLEVIYVEESEDGGLQREFAVANPEKRVYEGQVLRYDYGEAPERPESDYRKGTKIPYLQLDVEEYVSQAEAGLDIRVAHKDEKFAIPLAKVIIQGESGIELERTLFPPNQVMYSPPLVHSHSGSKVRFRLTDNTLGAKRLLVEPVPLSYGVLWQTVGEAVVGEPLKIEPGKKYTVEGDGETYEVEILQAVPFLRLRPGPAGDMEHDPINLPLEEQEPRNPAVRLRLTNSAGDVEYRWVAQNELHETQKDFKDLNFKFLWEPWASPAYRRIYLFMFTDETMAWGRLGEPDSLQPIKPGEAMFLDDNHELQLIAAYRQGIAEPTLEAVEGADFFHPAQAAIRVRARTPDWERSFVLSGGEEGSVEQFAYAGPGGEERQVYMRFREKREDLPLEWRSKITILEAPGADGHELTEKFSGEIRVNDYLYYKGFRFFQTNADPNDPTYSGVGIVYDPGIETVLAGLYMVACGTIVAFLINPLIFRSKKKVA